MASHGDDAVLPGEDLSSSSQDDDEDDVVDDDEDDDEDLENDDVLPDQRRPTSSSSAAAANTVTVALPAIPKGEPPSILATAATAVIANPSGSDRHRIDLRNDAVSLVAQPEEKKPAALDDSRKLFQRLWTDEDEIELLQGFLDYTAQRGKTTHHGQNDTALFYDQIKSKLQLDFNKNQLVEKLRRLKKKYRNVVNKISSGKEFTFKSPHDQATFEISRKIWSDIGQIGPAAADDNAFEDDDPNPNSNANFNSIEVKSEDAGVFSKTPPRSRKRSRQKSDLRTEERRFFIEAPATTIKDNCNNNSGGNNHSNGNVQGLIEDTVRSCLSPLLKELLSNATGGPCAAASASASASASATAATRGFGVLALNPIPPLSFGIPPMNLGFGELADERWRKQQILELEVYSKRLELVQDQIKEALDELRSKGGT